MRIPFVHAGGPVALAGILFLASGCAALSDGLTPDIGPSLTGLDSPPITTTGADLIALDQPPVAAATEPELIAHCRSRLAHYKCPTSVELRDTLVRTATGKLQKFKLRSPYWEGREKQVN